MAEGRCCKTGCEGIGVYQAYVELWPLFRDYEGAPAQLFFPELIFCEEHSKELTWKDLVNPPAITEIFRGLGRREPDFAKTQLKLVVVPGQETV